MKRCAAESRYLVPGLKPCLAEVGHIGRHRHLRLSWPLHSDNCGDRRPAGTPAPRSVAAGGES